MERKYHQDCGVKPAEDHQYSHHLETLTISLTHDDGGLLLTIEDNGKGMGMEDRRKRKSFGLIGMRERVHTIGGDLSIHSRPMAGTRVEVHVPHAVVVTSLPAPVSRQ
jgi:glucose-6-phosphate-specific signal transduction histidine kinase